ncbi:multidrug efflux transporter transcriptional repressor AcrR [Photorhabdus caribbeanensis]|uniref:multidrug efflux transporter transcriptional repressor AcrR n=1 Tax=Photorhabdus caribbeanensis TaxID=1004165 RepID=UPI001BD56A56|nr:multidrug efflux transporter transcriptional repressor AcrR [Photorhabdus caribbeanensis]MBS9425255.1 DNA-binding transcriptional repressor AcrR [Photorhabdus caribbeanensis]
MARKTKQQAEETRQQIIDAAIKEFSERGVSATSLTDIATTAGVTRGAIYWHFKNKVDLFSEACRITDSKIDELEKEYQAKYPNNPLLILRTLIIHILTSVIDDPKNRLLMEIFFHKCEFVGEMSALVEVRQELCVADYVRIEESLSSCIASGQLPYNLHLRRAAIMLRGLITGLLENWLFAPDSFDIQKEAESLVDSFIDMLKYSEHMKITEK